MAVLFSARFLFAQEAPSVSSVPAYAPNAQWWGEARFGLFVHWGPVTLKGTEIGWSRDPGPNGARGGSVPAAEYDALYQRFNPTNFNARQWVAIAKAAGMKYLVFTTKHHDGFCEFDSQLTDYKLTNPGSPFHRDVVKELSQACAAGGLRFGMYYSQPDEHHLDYRTSKHKRYQDYLQGQVRELLTGYGQVSVLWFDGLGGTAQDWNSKDLMPMIRQLQPGILINDRCGVPADFDTPEQHIGRFQIGRPWESCITICQQWAWKPNDELKSLKQCLDTLIRCSGGDGNLLLNVGPMPDGRIEPRQEARLKEVGAWLEKYGDSIYGTRGGPWQPSSTVASTRKENTIFVHVLRWKDDAVVLPNPGMKFTSAALLTGGSVKLQQDAGTISLSVAPEARRDLDTIVKLTVEGSALQIAPLPGAVNVQGYKVTASNVHHHAEDYSAEKAVDGDRETRWATDEGTRAAWLEVDLGRTTTFSRIGIDEWAPGGKRIQKFELQSWDGARWRTFYAGTTAGADWETKFSPVQAKRVRLNILEATEGPTINEFGIYPK